MIPEEKIYDWFAPEFEAVSNLLVCLCLCCVVLIVHCSLSQFWNASQQPGMPALNVWIYVTKAVTVEKANIMTPGKPDFHAVMDTVVTECPNKSVQVFACGPEQSTPPLFLCFCFHSFAFVRYC